jgi:methionyl-tRNA formyltransferase
VPSLRALVDSGVDVHAVVTNPDKPFGRKQELRPSPVKEAALEAGLEIVQPRSARDPEFHEWLEGASPDVAIVVAYGKILPQELLDVPPRGFVNVHFSLLPEYRGAAPVQRALMEGRTRTGVSLMVLTAGMDEGPLLAVEETEIGSDESAAVLGARLATIGAPLLVDVLPRYVAGELEPVPQDDALATYAPKITTDEARIDWSRPAEELDGFVRGLDPEPGAWTELQGSRLKVFRLRPAGGAELSPGEVRAGGSLTVGTGSQRVELLEVQAAGKRRMTGAELARGIHLPSGARCE